MNSLKQVLFLFLLFTGFAAAQELYFCEGVDDDGNPKNASKVFTISEDGGYLYFLMRLDETVDCNSIDFMVYSVNSDGDETYDNMISMDVEPEWTFFWKKINFYRSGKFKVYVYNEYDELLTSGTVKIKVE